MTGVAFFVRRMERPGAAVLGVLHARGWVVQRRLRTRSDAAVLLVGPRGAAPEAVVKLATTEAASASLVRERAALAALAREGALGEWRTLLPEVLASGDAEGRTYVVERLLLGVEARSLRANGHAAPELAAARAIGLLHRATASEHVVGADSLARWLDAPLQMLERTPAMLKAAPALMRLREVLRRSLEGRRVASSWSHGDYWLGNVLIDPATRVVTGIVDWEHARPHEPSALDLAHLLLCATADTRRREVGSVVLDWLAGDRRGHTELRLLEDAQAELPGEPIPLRPLLLLCWLRHVAGNLEKSTLYGRHPVWLRRNVRAVIEAVDR
jgi:Ser/Thr protein kinase RdoA (MazF antagonist)